MNVCLAPSQEKLGKPQQSQELCELCDKPENHQTTWQVNTDYSGVLEQDNTLSIVPATHPVSVIESPCSGS